MYLSDSAHTQSNNSDGGSRHALGLWDSVRASSRLPDGRSMRTSKGNFAKKRFVTFQSDASDDEDAVVMRKSEAKQLLGRRKFRQFLNQRFTDVEDSSDDLHKVDPIWSVLPEWQSKFTACPEFFEGVNKKARAAERKRMHPSKKKQTVVGDASLASRFRQLRRTVRVAIKRGHPQMVLDMENLLTTFHRLVSDAPENARLGEQEVKKSWEGSFTDCFHVIAVRELKKQGLPAEVLQEAETSSALFLQCKDSFYRTIVHGMCNIFGFKSASYATSLHTRVMMITPRKTHKPLPMSQHASLFGFLFPSMARTTTADQKKKQQEQTERKKSTFHVAVTEDGTTTCASEIEGEDPFLLLAPRGEAGGGGEVVSEMDGEGPWQAVVSAADDALSDNNSPIESYEVVLDI